MPLTPRGDRDHDHMTIKVTATEAKARILSLLDEVAAGQEVEITKRGRTVARLVPADRTSRAQGPTRRGGNDCER